MAAQFPTPTGGQTPPIGVISSGLTEQQLAERFDAHWPGTGAGQGYLDYAQAHPQLTAQQAANVFGLNIAVGGVAKAVGDAANGLAKFLNSAGPAAGATAKSLTSDLNPLAGIASAISAFTSKNLWMRVGEVVVGVILLAIGVNALFKGKPLNVVTKAAGAAAVVG
jgi:hypothetical protein